MRKLDLRLDSLNVLVGTNGAGKTNLLKTFQFLGEVARRELAPAIQGIGGFDELIYRGKERANATVRIELQGQVTKHASLTASDEYRLSFWRVNRGPRRDAFHLPEIFQRHETLVFKRTQGPGRRITLRGGRVSVGVVGAQSTSSEQSIQIQDSATGLGTLRRLSDEFGSPEWNAFAEVVEDLRLFEIDVEKVRAPSNSSSHKKLLPDASNLAAFLLYVSREHSSSFEDICEDVRYVLPSFVRFDFVELGGPNNAIRLDIVEKALTGSTPLARASYGTIRAIALFAMLHDPFPPKLTCMEEVDHGLHPHALDRVVARLRQASEKTQIILATHSPALVNRFAATELIIVERDIESGASRLQRPDRNLVNDLMNRTDYQLGELWFSGVLGGGLE
ncbi:MAG: AAA family ATPase [Janthinobacterium lividum]